MLRERKAFQWAHPRLRGPFGQQNVEWSGWLHRADGLVLPTPWACRSNPSAMVLELLPPVVGRQELLQGFDRKRLCSESELLHWGEPRQRAGQRIFNVRVTLKSAASKIDRGEGGWGQVQICGWGMIFCRHVAGSFFDGSDEVVQAVYGSYVDILQNPGIAWIAPAIKYNTYNHLYISNDPLQIFRVVLRAGTPRQRFEGTWAWWRNVVCDILSATQVKLRDGNNNYSLDQAPIDIWLPTRGSNKLRSSCLGIVIQNVRHHKHKHFNVTTAALWNHDIGTKHCQQQFVLRMPFFTSFVRAQRMLENFLEVCL